MEYEEAIKILTSQEKFCVKLGLERIEKILSLIGNPQDKLNCIHVAGTNGKGSVCAIIAKIIQDSGIKTGLYTSPHIFDYTDNGVDVVVLETGLGGHFDATNVIKKNLCSIITHIDLDHTDRLGKTKSAIAFEKSGII